MNGMMCASLIILLVNNLFSQFFGSYISFIDFMYYLYAFSGYNGMELTGKMIKGILGAGTGIVCTASSDMQSEIVAKILSIAFSSLIILLVNNLFSQFFGSYISFIDFMYYLYAFCWKFTACIISRGEIRRATIFLKRIGNDNHCHYNKE